MTPPIPEQLKTVQLPTKPDDGYRSRITIPIIDRMGHYVGLAGRYIEIEETDKGKAYPKYINPADCELYNKSTVLFGLNRAQKAIKEKGCAILVEGNFDVITPHLHGCFQRCWHFRHCVYQTANAAAEKAHQ
jgi:DNA primase